MWIQIDTFIFGRILTQKSEAQSRLIYLGFSLSTSGRCIKDINQILYTFIRKNKHYYIRKSDVVKPISKGELNVIYLDVVTLKLRRLQAFLRNKHSDGSYNYFYDFC